MNFRQVRGIYRLHHVEIGSRILLSVQFNGECGRLYPQPLGKSDHSPLFIAEAENTRRFTSSAPYAFKAVAEGRIIKSIYKYLKKLRYLKTYFIYKF